MNVDDQNLGKSLPEQGVLAGYARLITDYELRVPIPLINTAIASRHHPRSTEEWRMLTPKHAPGEGIGDQLEFALKWEGVNLSVMAALFRKVEPELIADYVRTKPRGSYARRIWFLYELLTATSLDLPKSEKDRPVPAIDSKQQFALITGTVSPQHKVINNLPGTRAFCPLIRRTPMLEKFVSEHFDERARELIGRTHGDVIARAAAFLLLSDSKASFTIEGERLSPQRAMRWAKAIGEAGHSPISVAELERLQRTVLGDSRFVHLGLRQEGGFIGDHDRQTGEPFPEHISARDKDLRDLVGGLIAYAERTASRGFDPVAAAAAIAFGFVYVHPFEDGNGRIHRWLIHHVLARAGYNPPGVVFPISAAILRDIQRYRRVLASYSAQVLPLIDWVATEKGNVDVLNETADFYRYFDATAHAEFLYECVAQTVEHELPDEVAYLQAYDTFAARVQEIVDMPARTIALLHRLLQSNGGRFSERAKTKEFGELTMTEIAHVEEAYQKCFRPAVSVN
ncbi:MAG: Fic family protein [Candidatus Sumerlaeaceae bacterium]